MTFELTILRLIFFFLMIRPPPRSTLFPYTPLSRSPPPLEGDQPLMAPPMSRLRLGVPPSFRNAVTPPVREPLLQVSHVTLAEPYPSPKPIQNPSRRWGYCARAADAVTLSKLATARMHAAVRMEASLRVTPGPRAKPVPGGRSASTAIRRPVSVAAGANATQALWCRR